MYDTYPLNYCTAVDRDMPLWSKIEQEATERAYGKILLVDEIRRLTQRHNTNTIPPTYTIPNNTNTYTIPETGVSIVALYGQTSGAMIGVTGFRLRERRTCMNLDY
jgi:hypothetical protein